MARYLSKERPLTPSEQLSAYRMRVREAQEEFARAAQTLRDTIEADLPLTTTDYVEVKPGEPGYEDAPYENTLIMLGEEMRAEIAKQPSPWLSLVECGKFPKGLT